MITKLVISNFLLLAAGFVIVSAQFEVPDATLEVLRPRGFRVSIPDVEGIKLFAFHGKLNEEMNGREGGTFSRDVTKAKNGRWTFYEPLTEIKVGDIIYYWTYVDYFDGKNKLGYPKDDQVFHVTEDHIVQNTGSTSTRPPVTTPTTTRRTTVSTTPSEITFCENSITTYNSGIRTCKGQLIFTDNFIKFNRNTWTPEMRFAGEPDYEFVMYSDQAQVLQVGNRRFTIKPVLSSSIFGEAFVTSREEYNYGSRCTGQLGTDECAQRAESFLIKPPVVSAQLSTKNSFSFLYGKIEVKARLPKGDWIYPELYLNPKSGEYGDHYQSGQIRIAFLPGNTELSKVIYGGCVLGNSDGGRSYAMKTIRRTVDWSNSYNRYAVEWTDEKITLTVNDNVYGNIFPPEGGFASLESTLDLEGCDRWRNSGTKMAPFDKEMYITIGVGVGGRNFPDRSDGTKPWVKDEPKSLKNFLKDKAKWYSTWGNHSVLDVEHVRVWAL